MTSNEAKKRGMWSQLDMENALLFVQKGHSQREAANKFGIPRRTLRNHIKSGSSIKTIGKNPVFSKDQEKEFVQRIIRYSEISLPLTPSIIKHQAFRFAEINNIHHPFNNNKQSAGKDWFKFFMKRHPNLSKRKSQLLNPARGQKMNHPIVKDYFKKLKHLMLDINVLDKPERIFNVDEKGCRLTIHHQQTVIALKGSKRVHLTAPEHAENVTIVACVSALGNSIPPMIIYKGKRLKPEWGDNLPSGTLIKMAPKGSMTTELFVQFLKHFSQYKLPGPVLLIFDGAKAHLDYTIVEEAEKYQISLLCLPSNTTHELQPLDKCVFRSFEHNWDQEVLNYWDNYPDRKINKTRFASIFEKVWRKSLTPSNIISGFRSTGIYPFDPTAIPEEAFAPSVLTERRYRTIDEFDENDDIPLALLFAEQNFKEISEQKKSSPVSFKTLLPTPTGKWVKPTFRKKALNYKAQAVSKDLFNKNDSELSLSLNSLSSESSSVLLNPSTSKPLSNSSYDSWYCSICKINEIRSMRQCVKCLIWAHEECIGFESGDDDDYLCVYCDS